MQIKQPVELIVEASWVMPVVPERALLEEHAVAVAEGRIVALAPAVELRERFSAREHLVRRGHVLLPGLVNAHMRAGELLPQSARVLDRVAEPEVARPWHGAAASGERARDSARLAIAQMLRAGITTFASCDEYPEETARAAADARMRAAIGLPLAGRPGTADCDPGAQLARAERLWDEHKSNPWVCLYFAPPAAHLLNDATLARVRTIADELDARITMPVHADAAEIGASGARYGCRPLERLSGLGLLRPGFTALHLNELQREELDLVARTAVSVVLTPQADLRRGRGPGALRELLAHGVQPGLGTGERLSGACLDVLAEARTAALLAGREAGSPAQLDAHTALRLGTLGGASALGLERSTGSIEPGKAADLITVDLAALACQPLAGAAETLLYGAERELVSDVWVGGRAAVSRGRLLAFDDEELRALAVRCGAPALRAFGAGMPRRLGGAP